MISDDEMYKDHNVAKARNVLALGRAASAEKIDQFFSNLMCSHLFAYSQAVFFFLKYNMMNCLLYLIKFL